MTTRNLFLARRSTWVASTFLTRRFWFSTRTRTSLMWQLTLRVFSSSRSTVLLVAAWSPVSFTTSAWMLFTVLSSSSCRSSMRCCVAFTLSMMPATRSSSAMMPPASSTVPSFSVIVAGLVGSASGSVSGGVSGFCSVVLLFGRLSLAGGWRGWRGLSSGGSGDGGRGGGGKKAVRGPRDPDGMKKKRVLEKGSGLGGETHTQKNGGWFLRGSEDGRMEEEEEQRSRFWFSTRTRTSLMWQLTLRVFSSSRSTVLLVAAWSPVSFTTSAWMLFTVLSSSSCRSSMRCCVAFTLSMMPATRSSSAMMPPASSTVPSFSVIVAGLVGSGSGSVSGGVSGFCSVVLLFGRLSLAGGWRGWRGLSSG
ncbi:LOW QUALITY PROTEIN: hypothetical protein CRUP_015690 [Coryphaenoides rupestris]|nr:LOW QUALITY PROTEIN: hypothetical protein CRUP_015690 [Coryphaenoides rupestris]